MILSLGHWYSNSASKSLTYAVEVGFILMNTFRHLSQNIILLHFFTFILINRANLNSLFISMTSKFADLIHNYNLNTKFCNDTYRSFETIHYLINSFEIVIIHKRGMISPKYFVCNFNSILIVQNNKNKTFILFGISKYSLQIYKEVLKKNGKRAITHQK